MVEARSVNNVKKTTKNYNNTLGRGVVSIEILQGKSHSKHNKDRYLMA